MFLLALPTPPRIVRKWGTITITFSNKTLLNLLCQWYWAKSWLTSVSVDRWVTWWGQKWSHRIFWARQERSRASWIWRMQSRRRQSPRRRSQLRAQNQIHPLSLLQALRRCLHLSLLQALRRCLHLSFLQALRGHVSVPVTAIVPWERESLQWKKMFHSNVGLKSSRAWSLLEPSVMPHSPMSMTLSQRRVVIPWFSTWKLLYSMILSLVWSCCLFYHPLVELRMHTNLPFHMKMVLLINTTRNYVSVMSYMNEIFYV